jgi:hypothetical protein
MFQSETSAPSQLSKGAGIAFKDVLPFLRASVTDPGVSANKKQISQMNVIPHKSFRRSWRADFYRRIVEMRDYLWLQHPNLIARRFSKPDRLIWSLD